jgi:response regulator RpfG family c-di-GMP phosphodiesterase/HAMP domain-containing protein
MKMDPTFLRSKVARRIFMLFIFCALVPIIALAIISFSQVTEQLYDQGQRRLAESSKAIGMSILERLCLIENELKVFSSSIQANPRTSMEKQANEYSTRLKQRLKGLVLIDDSGKYIRFFGSSEHLPERTEEEKQYLMSGKTLVVTQPDRENLMHIYMMGGVDPQEPKQGILCGEIDPMYLWVLTPDDITKLSVLDNTDNIIYTTIPPTSSFYEKLGPIDERGAIGQFEWKYQDKEYMTSFRDIFLKAQFLYPQWTVVLSVSKDDIFAPLAYFKKIFPHIILLSLCVVLLLSIIQIRRTMNPLEKLKDGTRQIAMREFDSRVEVSSGDEFEELAASFNDMAKQLGRQFKALTTMAEIDRAILSALDTEKIVNTVITRMKEFFRFDLVGVTLLDSKGENSPQTYVGSAKQDRVRIIDDIEVMPEEAEKLTINREILVRNAGEDLPSYLVPFARGGITTFVVLPLFIKQKLAGIITLGALDSDAPDQEDLHHARQLADQVAVALSNAQLIEELDLLNWGTLTALARTVDAKSPWTAGHSERVTEQALKIGKAMKLTPNELEDLHRGALLHDIGKIGVPVSVLDKPEVLTEEEYKIIQAHPHIGARILEPIAAYAPIIPVVLEHHEHFNGEGYPNGLAGEGISIGARILAVADVFDALISDRPYRKGMELEATLTLIKEKSGEQFDPIVVKAFLEIIKSSHGVKKQGEA